MAEKYPHVAVEDFQLPDDLEVTLWAKSPMFFNPTNMDVDYKGRIWVNEGRAYRAFRNKFASEYAKKGDRIMVLEDSDQDGTADKSHVFVQDPQLIAPLGIAVIDNKVVVSQPPSIIVYHDVNRDAVFDPKVDKKEELLTGFGGFDHDHSLHAVTVGPSGQWYFNSGNAGTHVVKDKDGFTIRVGSSYKGGAPSVTKKGPNQGGKAGLVSDDGHVYVGSVALRMNPDGTGLRVIGHNMRNSYEETVTSFGDVFQNDNDDPPACRVTWLMEYGNLGFASDDGSRTWLSERRPGQRMSSAHWRQDDPGKIPAGDIYGNGSPTGITFYENGALGEKWEGLLLSGEAARNVVFGYQPKPEGAGFELKRTNFFGIKESALSGKSEVSPNNFRPADITVGADGCIYVADWFDPGVGGHKMADQKLAGAIYRIAPKGKNPQTPAIDLTTTEGQITALKSPAINVRNLGFTRLKAQGEAGIPAVKTLLGEDSDYFKARAIWLLAQMGDKGIAEVKNFLQSTNDPQLKIVCFRALRFIDHKVLEFAQYFSKDDSIAVRREVALALRDSSWEEAGSIIYDLAVQYDGEDRWYLEAIGTAATGKEVELYQALVKQFDAASPVKWSVPMARLAWRLHPDEAVDAFKARAIDGSIDAPLREEMLTALGYIDSEQAALAMVEIAENGPKDTAELAKWWLHSLSSGKWKNYKGKMKGFDKKLNALSDKEDYIVPIDGPALTEPSVEEVLKLTGDPEKGKATVTRCWMCHQIDGQGVEFGPTLTEWGIGRSVEAIADAIINPSEGVAHGFDGTIVKMKSGNTIQGISLSGGGKAKQLVVRVMGGKEVEVNSKGIKEREEMERSLMLSAGQLGLSSQDVADIAAYLRELGKEKSGN
ncbi:PVC-type heme-binding CxxCH protein [Rubritalea spongiae]|uniref:PVC-type heme-binding CxxCH protein n=1 Tax=Rubritalea spongiae TaxID=430797 RepID=A0ABW5E698_9BACT